MEAGVIPFGTARKRLSWSTKWAKGNRWPYFGRWYGVHRQGLWPDPRAYVKVKVCPLRTRAVKGIGITYATTTMGADHTPAIPYVLKS